MNQAATRHSMRAAAMTTPPQPKKSAGITHDAKRFVIVGCLAYAVDYLVVFQLLTDLAGLHPVLAEPISRIAGGCVSFTLNKFWTFRFRSQQTAALQQFRRYAIVWCVALAISMLCLKGLFDGLGLHEDIAKPIANAIAGLCSFLAQRYWAFR